MPNSTPANRAVGLGHDQMAAGLWLVTGSADEGLLALVEDLGGLLEESPR